MNTIFFIIGASGAGKTIAVKNIQKSQPDDFHFCYFDSVGVPSPEEMKTFDDRGGWQKVTTKYWVEKIKVDYAPLKKTILDGQIRPEFIDEACKSNGIADYRIVLFDCTDEIRSERLIERGHPELVNPDMMNWAKYLREEALLRSCKIVDNTELSQEESRDMLLSILKE